LSRIGRFSPRAASMRNAMCAFPRVLAAGLVLPLASPTDFRRSGSKGSCAHVMPLSIFAKHGSPPLASCHRRAPNHVEIHGHASRGRRFDRQSERANASPSTDRIEATSVAGSFRRRAPVAA
jgi:hypothetical protein